MVGWVADLHIFTKYALIITMYICLVFLAIQYFCEGSYNKVSRTKPFRHLNYNNLLHLYYAGKHFVCVSEVPTGWVYYLFNF